MIPRRFFWLFDLLTLGGAFLAAYLIVPQLQPLLAPSGLLRTGWIEVLSLPPNWGAQLPPLTGLLWIFLAVALTTILVLEVLGAYRGVGSGAPEKEYGFSGLNQSFIGFQG